MVDRGQQMGAAALPLVLNHVESKWACSIPACVLARKIAGRIPPLGGLRTQTLLSWARPWLVRVFQTRRTLPCPAPLLEGAERQFLCSHTKKHDNGVHIIPPVFTSFLSPLDYTCSSKGVYTHTSTLGHTVMPLHATHHR
jgi:hypothetical protein